MSGERQSPAQPANTWLSRPARGALLGMRALFWIATALGRGPARQLVRVIALFAILADRVGLNDKYTTVDFFGQPATFPTEPFVLAAALKAPVYLVLGLYFEPNRYELFCGPFAERIALPRKQGASALQEVAQRYARRLEVYARMAPDNWFNFHDIWKNSRA